MTQSRAEADSSTVTSNERFIVITLPPTAAQINEAEADAVEKCNPSTISDETMEEEEASGSNICDNEDAVSVTEDDEGNPSANRDVSSCKRHNIRVHELPTHYGLVNLKRFLKERMGITPKRLKLASARAAYVTFDTEDERLKAKTVINNYVWRRHTIKADLVKPAPDPLMLNRSQHPQFSDYIDIDENEDIAEGILKATAPWADIPYETQLLRKMRSVQDFVKLLYKGIANVNAQLKLDLCNAIVSIRPSPLKKGYRNTCEFTIGIHPDTNEKTIGVRAGSFKTGLTAVGPIDHLPQLPKVMIDAVNGFQNFIRSPSEPDWDPYDPETFEGLWKSLTVRVSRSGEVLMLLVINGPVHDFDHLKNAIREYYVGNSIVSTFLIKVVEPDEDTERKKPEIIFGNGYITEEIMGLKFRVTAEAFFQINTPAAEVMYTTIRSVVGVNSQTTVLDLCCGTGAIGMTFTNECQQVVGIEMDEDAVADANVNAAINTVQSKCRFYANKAENVLEAIFGMTTFNKMIAVVDPPRGGLHNKVVQSLRRNDKFDTIIYVSCDPKAAMINFIDFCRPESKNYKGNPFMPTQFFPVDLFPDSPHFVLIIVFQRVYLRNAKIDVKPEVKCKDESE